MKARPAVSLSPISFQSFDPTADAADRPSVVLVRQTFAFDDASGMLVWKRPTGPRVHVGERAGTKHRSGYWRVAINRRSYPVAHIVWVLSYGVWPRGELDHRDLNKDNNRIRNLREATRGQNEANKPSRSKHGVKGVCFEPKTGRWRAKIELGGKGISLGTYATIDEAAAAYRCAAVAHHGEFVRA